MESPADHPDQIDRLVMIGDSLTDTGNFYRDSGEAYPNRKVYIDKEGQYKGRFTNGKVWADYAEDLLRNVKPSWTIDPLAYGGATSGPGVASGSNKVHGQLRETVNGDQQLAKFKMKYDPLAASRSVVVVWIGSNDLLHSVKANVKKTLYSDGLLGPTLYNVKNLIDQLLDYGCARVVVVNIPELGHLPAVAIRRAIMKDKLGLTHRSSGDLSISEAMNIPPAVPIPIQKTRQRKPFSDWNELPSRGSQASLITDNLSEPPESMPDLSSTDSVASSQSSSGHQWAKKLFRKPSRAVLGKVVDGFFDLAVGRLTASIQRYSQLLQEWVASHQHRDRLLFVDINPKFREVIEGATNKDPCVTTDDKAGPSLGFGSTQLVKCASPENHIFMDEIHPTSSVHEKLAGFILAQIRPDDFAAIA
ncbi:hypothetical protein IWQ60_005168 [Tieghemiomyces parasiticus]|uniref:Uncharacterized protein n=1 Tax=Tieghemiomyces parasiticus TaxID=78921 RepID=A0A9W8AEK0_9FUNG|nr:hypothetical protein IWQ60_005168 [Tieghemiomyces parasiticus]